MLSDKNVKNLIKLQINEYFYQIFDWLKLSSFDLLSYLEF